MPQLSSDCARCGHEAHAARRWRVDRGRWRSRLGPKGDGFRWIWPEAQHGRWRGRWRPSAMVRGDMAQCSTLGAGEATGGQWAMVRGGHGPMLDRSHRAGRQGTRMVAAGGTRP